MWSSQRLLATSLVAAAFGVFAGGWAGLWLVRGSYLTALLFVMVSIWGLGFGLYLPLTRFGTAMPRVKVDAEGTPHGSPIRCLLSLPAPRLSPPQWRVAVSVLLVRLARSAGTAATGRWRWLPLVACTLASHGAVTAGRRRTGRATFA